MTGEEARASVWDEASSIVERATAGMPDVCSDIQAAVVEMVEVQLGNVYKLGYLQGLAEGPGWSGVSPMPGDRVLAAIRLREYRRANLVADARVRGLR